MKKLVSLLLCVIMVMALMSISASAEEPITLTIERSEHASFTYSLEQPVIKELEKRLGIKLEIHAYPSSDFNTKLKIQLGTDDLPDIVCNTYSKLVDYVSEDMYVNLSEHMDQLPNYAATLEKYAEGYSAQAGAGQHLYVSDHSGANHAASGADFRIAPQQ